MPAYQIVVPIATLYPGQVGYSFGAPDPRDPQGTPVAGEAAVEEAGAAFALHATPDSAKGLGAVTWTVSYPAAPDSATAQLQGAILNEDDAYATIDSTTALGDVRVVTGIGAFKFLRVNISALGGSGTIIAAIAVS